MRSVHIRLFGLIGATLYSGFVLADTPRNAVDACGLAVDHVTLEIGHHQPFPELLPPNDGSKEVGWINLNKMRRDLPLTLHCFPTADEKGGRDIALPATVAQCVLDNGRVLCGGESDASTPSQGEGSVTFGTGDVDSLFVQAAKDVANGVKQPDDAASRAAKAIVSGNVTRGSEGFACKGFLKDATPADTLRKRLKLDIGADGAPYFHIGDGDWRQEFKGATAQQRNAFQGYTKQDGWVVWRVQRDPVVWLTVQYMFGSPGGTCIMFPEKPEHINPYYMPSEAVSYFYQQLVGGSAPDLDTMRRVLREKEGRSLPEPENPSPSFSIGVDAQKPDIENACGIKVANALVELGKHQPPKVFTPEEKNGRWEFNYLNEADEPMSVMCFRTKDESSLFRVPLPDNLSRCVLANGDLSCWGGAVKAANVVSAPDIPAAVLKSFKEKQEECNDGDVHADAYFGDKFMTVVDIDGDGRDDYILNGDEVVCKWSNGERPNIGNGGTSFTIYMGSPKGIVKTYENFLQGARVLKFKGYAVLDVAGGPYRVKSGIAKKLRSAPAGGQLIYELSR